MAQRDRCLPFAAFWKEQQAASRRELGMVPCQPFYLLRGDTGLADALPIFSDMVVVKVSFYQETSGGYNEGTAKQRRRRK